MSPAFRAALARTLEYEGGIVEHPADPGGRTNQGVTQRAYDAYRRTTGQPPRRVDDMTDHERDAIYHDDYWQPCSGDALPPRLAAAVFDMAVNSGPYNAKLELQRALRVRADGFVGPVTIAAAAKAGDEAVLPFLKRRGAFVADIIERRPGQVVFLAGWIGRLLDQAYRP